MALKTLRPDGATKTIERVLIANRGEIAFRISKTLRKMKIQSVGLCIPGEKNASFLSLCDEVKVFARNDLSAYLDIEEIIRITKEAHADAIHPGYGFLSENPAFAKACEKNGIIFIGPESNTIELMGNKHKAKEFAKKCGVPILETLVESKELDPEFEKKAAKLSLPIILKPLSGGGGKGMMIVRNISDLQKKIEEGRNVAKKAFGDSRLLAEPLIEKALHIEVQVIGDQFGNVQHLFERDCTIQRRHQKIIEETPSPIIDSALLEKIYQKAVMIASSSKYKSLGTVEFILDQNKNYYFMEMNTRLQVEHPVTEVTLGLDLVKKQILIAQGASLSTILPKKINQKGHAIEVRIYSENPEQNFLPSTGTIVYAKFPKETKNLRLDCGIELGSKITHSFDPMILKLTTHGKTRDQAITLMLEALQKTVVFGVHTNIDYLQWVLQHNDFVQSNHFTNWTDKTLKEFQEVGFSDETLKLIISSFEKEKTRRQSEWRNDPWLTIKMLEHAIKWKNENFLFLGDMSQLNGTVVETLNSYWVSIHGNTFVVRKEEVNFESDEQLSTNHILAPMTGMIVKICVSEGDSVKKGDLLAEMEAMKMQYQIEASKDGKVEKILCQKNEIVEQESTLIELV